MESLALEPADEEEDSESQGDCAASLLRPGCEVLGEGG